MTTVRTTVTVPVTWAARVAVQAEGRLLFSYGYLGSVSHRQDARTQAMLNAGAEDYIDEYAEAFTYERLDRWAAQARKQRGLGP